MIRQYAELLRVSMVECRKAEQRDPEYGEIKVYNLLEGLEETIEETSYHGGIYTEHELRMTATEYWRDILRAQITCIEIAGGFELMREVCEALEELEGNDEYEFVSLFDSCADGIGTWMK